MWQVETFPVSQILHNLHLCASRSLSGHLRASKTPSRSAVCISPPLLKCFLTFLRVYMCSTVSQSNFRITCSYLCILGNHLVQLQISPLFIFGRASPCICHVCPPVDWFPKSSKQSETSVLAQVSWASSDACENTQVFGCLGPLLRSAWSVSIVSSTGSLVLGFFFLGCALSSSSVMTAVLQTFEACTLLPVSASLYFAGSLQTQAGHSLIPLVEPTTPPTLS